MLYPDVRYAHPGRGPARRSGKGMEHTLMKMLRLPMDVMVSGMEAIVRTMHEIQYKMESHDSPSSGGAASEEDKPSMFSNVLRLTMTPLFELYKIPASALVAGFETISGAMDAHQNAPPAIIGTNQDASRYVSHEAVALDDSEAAVEQGAWLADGREDASRSPVWQIGRPGRTEHAAAWTPSFDYTVGKDIDPLNDPHMPHLLAVQGGPKSHGATEKLNLLFALDRDYGPGTLALIYDRWGGEKDLVSVDHQLLAPVRGAGEGKLRHVALALGAIARGDHVITFTASGDTTEHEHRIDYVKLTEVDPAPSTD